MPYPNFTKEELSQWIKENYGENFNILFKRWIQKGCIRDLVPSLNRLNDYKPYTLDNIELVTWKENNILGRTSLKTIKQVHKKLGKIAKDMYSKKVLQIDRDTKQIINEYPSVREAARHNSGFDNSTISKVCRGEKKTHKGYIWKYKNSKGQSKHAKDKLQ